jgi:hypothetical protein
MKTRTDLLNHLAEKYNLKRYLEIGVQDPKQNFDKIICKQKVSVDPDQNAGAGFQMISDDFFNVWTANINYQEFDLIFIDGLHTAEQVKKDFESALKILSPGGFIVLHDCNPEKEEHTIVPRPTKTGHWNGDVYKFAVAFEESPHVHTVDIDNGCMVIQFKEGLRWKKVDFILWDFFDQYRKELLHLISWEEFTNVTTLR